MPVAMEEKIQDVRERMAEAAAKTGRRSEDITLIAVTKLHSPEEINRAIACGITDIGENKVQEIQAKYDKVKPVRWHMIGHLQTNKVKYIIDKVVLIHSVDSLRLAQEIDKRAGQAGRVMDVLIQVNAAGEASKFGIAPEEASGLVAEIEKTCPHVRIRGFMCVAPYEEDPNVCRPFFAAVRKLYDEGKYDCLSMGMSHDYPVAIEEGSNMIRVGRSLFGDRDYRSEEK